MPTVELRSAKAINVAQVRSWANQLAGEARDRDWLRYSYVPPEVLRDVHQELTSSTRGLIGLIGQQGVGKSSALMALQKGIPYSFLGQRVLFKWRRKDELFKALLTFTHEATDVFLQLYLISLVLVLRDQLSEMNDVDKKKFNTLQEREKAFQLFRQLPEELMFDISWAESKLGRAATQKLREDTWLKVLSEQDVILIDTPDYSKTDKRQMDADLQEIYWFWHNLVSHNLIESRSTIVVAIQREMFHDHFFLDKMRKFELSPLPPDQMVKSYRLKFGTTYPFTESGLMSLARLSRGIYRRFLRYIVLALDFWSESKSTQSQSIDVETVRKAIPLERLAEDLELEFTGLFPKHSDVRLLAVRVIMCLQESGPRKQSQLAQELDVEPFTMSRLLTKLETSKHIIRAREGVDKVVSLPTLSVR